MKILGANVPRGDEAETGAARTVVSVAPDGTIDDVRRPASLLELVSDVDRMTGDEPYLLGVDVAVRSPAEGTRSRPVDGLLKRRLGFKPPPHPKVPKGGPARADHTTGEVLRSSLAAAGHPCRPYPPRDRHASGLAEIYPDLSLRAFLWLTSDLARHADLAVRAESFRSFTAPPYRRGSQRSRSTWTARAASIAVIVRALADVGHLDLSPVRSALASASGDAEVDRAASLLDATLVAATLSRYLEAPEHSLFVGDRETGHVVLPADAFVRELALRDLKPQRGKLFAPATGLRERLSRLGSVRDLDLVVVDGRPRRLESVFSESPTYAFDNVDEMLWWKHCRHLSGPKLPTDGLVELVVALDPEAAPAARPLRLVRSRHAALSFRFDVPEAWRKRLTPRDRSAHTLRVLRATYEAA